MRDRELGLTTIGQITDLAASPGFQALRERYEHERALIERRHATTLLSGGADAPAVDQRVVDYQRGFLNGVKWLLNSPGEMGRLEDKLHEEQRSANGGQPRR